MPFSFFTVASKHYEWQVLINCLWLSIDNDFVIEAHYTQPGAKEIRINTEYGSEPTAPAHPCILVFLL